MNYKQQTDHPAISHGQPIAHVDRDGKPLCNQDGSVLYLCEPDEFDRLPNIQKCGRCERSLDRPDRNQGQ